MLERGGLGHDPEIAGQGQGEAAARGHAVDGGDDRLVHAANLDDGLVERARHFMDGAGRPNGRTQEVFQVAAGAEGPARAGDDHGAHLRIDGQGAQLGGQGCDQVPVNGVKGLGPV